MPFEYFDVTAEIGIRASGSSYEEAFAVAAKALFALMVDISKIRISESRDISVRTDSLEVLLADWLNQLIIERDRSGLVFSEFEIKILRPADGWEIKARAYGERLNRALHDPRMDVKAITYHGLRCVQHEEVYMVQCVLDI